MEEQSLMVFFSHRTIHSFNAYSHEIFNDNVFATLLNTTAKKKTNEQTNIKIHNISHKKEIKPIKSYHMTTDII